MLYFFISHLKNCFLSKNNHQMLGDEKQKSVFLQHKFYSQVKFKLS